MRIKLLIMMIITVFQLMGNNEILYLTSLEWPPYTGQDLYSYGMSSYVVQKVFEKEGYIVHIEFFPWSRAVYNAKKQDKYIAYFPEYYSKDLEKDFYFSDSIGKSPLGFVEQKEELIEWNELSDLKAYKIGIVQDYVNTEEFDTMVVSNRLLVEVVTNDFLNIRKVAGGRIDLAVIDKNVLEYYLDYDKRLSRIKEKVEFGEKLLSERDLHICFPRTAKGREMLEVFNEGLKKINLEETIEEYKEQAGL